MMNGHIPASLHEYQINMNQFTIFNYDDHFRSYIGRAFLEWNSVAGVSLLVCDCFMTAFVACITCECVRSFDGDRDHHNEHTAVCQYANMIAKGKKKAVTIDY